MKVVLFIATFSAAHVLTGAHLCLIEPKQRGSISGLNKPASKDCILLTSPCGKRAPESPRTIFVAGKNETIIFQKNLDHFNKATPGYFAIAVMNELSALKEIGRIPDKGEPSLSLYTADIVMPMGFVGQAIMQVVYVTMNTQAPPVFYQCADIMIK